VPRRKTRDRPPFAQERKHRGSGACCDKLVARETVGLKLIKSLHAYICVAISFHGWCAIDGCLDGPCRIERRMWTQVVYDIGNRRFGVNLAERRFVFVCNLRQDKGCSPLWLFQ
jgi:hypothetical protein